VKNTNQDLRNHMFAMLELLSDETIDKKDIKQNIEKAKAVSALGKVVIEVQKVELLATKVRYEQQERMGRVLITDMPVNQIENNPIVRPKAEYTNPQFGNQ